MEYTGSSRKGGELAVIQSIWQDGYSYPLWPWWPEDQRRYKNAARHRLADWGSVQANYKRIEYNTEVDSKRFLTHEFNSSKTMLESWSPSSPQSRRYKRIRDQVPDSEEEYGRIIPTAMQLPSPLSVPSK